MGLGDFQSFLPPKVVQAPTMGRVRSEGEGEGKNEGEDEGEEKGKSEGEDESKDEVVMKIKAC